MLTLHPILYWPHFCILSGQGCSLYRSKPWRALRHVRGSTSETGRQVLAFRLGLPSPRSHNHLGRTRWVSNLWGLLKKTWKPQSYHPSAIWVFDPIFSSSIAWYHITFQSQSEEMMNGGLCGEGFLGLAKSQWLVRQSLWSGVCAIKWKERQVNESSL